MPFLGAILIILCVTQKTLKQAKNQNKKRVDKAKSKKQLANLWSMTQSEEIVEFAGLPNEREKSIF